VRAARCCPPTSSTAQRGLGAWKVEIEIFSPLHNLLDRVGVCPHRYRVWSCPPVSLTGVGFGGWNPTCRFGLGLGLGFGLRMGFGFGLRLRLAAPPPYHRLHSASGLRTWGTRVQGLRLRVGGHIIDSHMMDWGLVFRGFRESLALSQSGLLTIRRSTSWVCDTDSILPVQTQLGNLRVVSQPFGAETISVSPKWWGCVGLREGRGLDLLVTELNRDVRVRLAEALSHRLQRHLFKTTPWFPTAGR